MAAVLLLGSRSLVLGGEREGSCCGFYGTTLTEKKTYIDTCAQLHELTWCTVSVNSLHLGKMWKKKCFSRFLFESTTQTTENILPKEEVRSCFSCLRGRWMHEMAHGIFVQHNMSHRYYEILHSKASLHSVLSHINISICGRSLRNLCEIVTLEF